MKSITCLVFSLTLVACTTESPLNEGADAATNNSADGSVGRADANLGSADGGGGGECQMNATGTAGTHLTINVIWSATTGVKAGQGELHIWTRNQMTFNGNNVTAVVSPCGSDVPEIERSALLGGGKVKLEIQPEVWDAPSMPTFTGSGTISGFDPGDTISMNPVATIVGASMTDPMNDVWPASGQTLNATDHDGSGQPGITTTPRADAPYTLPPVDIIGALLPNGERADKLYIATRTIIELSGTRTSCTSASGTAIVSRFDTHVVGCHLASGSECNPGQANFVDSNRMLYQIQSATYEMKRVTDGASCADVRAALP